MISEYIFNEKATASRLQAVAQYLRHNTKSRGTAVFIGPQNRTRQQSFAGRSQTHSLLPNKVGVRYYANNADDRSSADSGRQRQANCWPHVVRVNDQGTVPGDVCIDAGRIKSKRNTTLPRSFPHRGRTHGTSASEHLWRRARGTSPKTYGRYPYPGMRQKVSGEKTYQIQRPEFINGLWTSKIRRSRSVA